MFRFLVLYFCFLFYAFYVCVLLCVLFLLLYIAVFFLFLYQSADRWWAVATGYGLNGPGIESWWGRNFPHLSRPALGPSQPSYTMGTGSFPGVKSGRGVTLTPHFLLVPWSRKSRAIPLLLLWAVRLVQSLSACTRVHFTFLPYRPLPPAGNPSCSK